MLASASINNVLARACINHMHVHVHAHRWANITLLHIQFSHRSVVKILLILVFIQLYVHVWDKYHQRFTWRIYSEFKLDVQAIHISLCCEYKYTCTYTYTQIHTSYILTKAYTHQHYAHQNTPHGSIVILANTVAHRQNETQHIDLHSSSLLRQQELQVPPPARSVTLAIPLSQ